MVNVPIGRIVHVGASVAQGAVVFLVVFLVARALYVLLDAVDELYADAQSRNHRILELEGRLRDLLDGHCPEDAA